MRVAITGASGLLGSLVRQSLIADGHEVMSIGRGGGSDVRWDPARGLIDSARLEGVDGVVHLAGESIGGERMLSRQWSPAKKSAILQSRIDGTSLIAETIADLATPPSVLVSASAAGYYGDRGDEELTEDAGPGDGFLSDVCVAWEAATAPAAAAGIRVATARIGVVISRQAEAFRRLLLPFRFGAGGPLGSGRQWWPLVSITDVVGALTSMVTDGDLAGPVNVVAPEQLRQKQLAKALGRAINRPSFIRTPAFALKLVLGGEFVDQALLASSRVLPAELLASNFRFVHPTIAEALQAEIE